MEMNVDVDPQQFVRYRTAQNYPERREIGREQKKKNQKQWGTCHPVYESAII